MRTLERKTDEIVREESLRELNLLASRLEKELEPISSIADTMDGLGRDNKEEEGRKKLILERELKRRI